MTVIKRLLFKFDAQDWITLLVLLWRGVKNMFMFRFSAADNCFAWVKLFCVCDYQERRKE